MNTGYIRAIYWILGIIFFVSVGAYILKFYNSPISGNPGDWGVLGDYLGGILNPVVAALNIAAFIYLTKVIGDTEEKAQKRNLDFQQKLTLSELRHASYVELTKNLDSLPERIFKGAENSDYETTLLMVYLRGFFENMTHLFPVFLDKVNTDPIINCIGKMTANIEKYEKSKKPEETQEWRKELQELLKTYYKEKTILVKKLQLEMI